MLRFYDDLIILGQKLRPRTYLKKLRIIEVNESIVHQGDNVCIFIIYERGRIPEMTWNAIKSIQEMGIKIFLVINSNLVDEEKDKVREIADFSMFRNNTGKDIGGYKDVYLHLHDKGYLKLINKLIFANDSVVYPQKFIKELFNKLVTNKSAMTGYSHVQEIHYHIQSFLFACDNTLINDKLFIKFWMKYLPIDRRRYMIHKGEVGITKSVIKTGVAITILNDISRILNTDMSAEKIYELVDSLPSKHSQRIGLIDDLNKFTTEYHSQLSKLLRNIKQNNINENIDNLIIKNSDDYKEIIKKQFLFHLIDSVSQRNATHWNTFNFIELGLPVIIKRDSVFRAGYNYDHFNSLLRKYLPDEFDSINYLIKKPSSTHLKGLKRVMFEDGMI